MTDSSLLLLNSVHCIPSSNQAQACKPSTPHPPCDNYENMLLTCLKTSPSEKDDKGPQEDASLPPDYEFPALKPVDGGFAAWRFIFTAFIIEGFVWGLPVSFGVFLTFSPYSDMSPSLAASIGTLCSGVLYCLGTLSISFLERNPMITSWCPTVGTLMCSASFLCASYSGKAWQLLLSQGLLYGIGGSLLYYPAMIFLAEWWVVRRGFAGSIMFSGTAAFGLIYPLVLEWSLKKYGTPLTLRGLAVAFLLGIVPLLPFFHGRLPLSMSRHRPQMRVGRYIRRPIFWAFLLLNFVQSLAFCVPALYLPSYAKTIGIPGGVILALYSAASVVGQIANGTLSDHYDLGCIICITSVLSSISIFALWGYSNGFAMLATFAVLYGLSAGGFSCLWHRFAMTVAPSEPNPGSLVVYFATTRGIGSVMTGPIAGAMLQGAPSSREAYKVLVHYSGALMMICAIGIGIRVLYPRE